MQEQPPLDGPSQPRGREAPAQRVLWGFVVLVFAGLLAADSYLVATGGFSVFVDSARFQWLALATFAVFVVLAWRITLRKFRRGFFLDRRDDMDFSRSRWRSRWRRGSR
jgi:hypothetical protein